MGFRITLWLNHGSAEVEANLLEDGHRRLDGLAEILLRFPDLEYLQLVTGAEADVVKAPGGCACTGRVETAHDLVVLRSTHGWRVQVDGNRHDFLPSSLAG